MSGGPRKMSWRVTVWPAGHGLATPALHQLCFVKQFPSGTSCVNSRQLWGIGPLWHEAPVRVMVRVFSLVALRPQSAWPFFTYSPTLQTVGAMQRSCEDLELRTVGFGCYFHSSNKCLTSLISGLYIAESLLIMYITELGTVVAAITSQYFLTLKIYYVAATMLMRTKFWLKRVKRNSIMRNNCRQDEVGVYGEQGKRK